MEQPNKKIQNVFYSNKKTEISKEVLTKKGISKIFYSLSKTKLFEFYIFHGTTWDSQ